MKDLFQLPKRGSESPTDITELFFALLFIAIGLGLLFIPASCKKNADKDRANEDIDLVDGTRDVLLLLYEPVGHGTIADSIILGIQDKNQLDLAKKQMGLRIGSGIEKNSNFRGQEVIVKKGNKEFLKVGQINELKGSSRHVLAYLPAVDGSIIIVETEVVLKHTTTLE